VLFNQNFLHSLEPPRDLYDRLSGEGVNHVYVDGGYTIQEFLLEGLIDEITVTVIPIILGEWIPLFGSLGGDIMLTRVRTKAFDFGFVQTTYQVKRKANRWA